MITFSTALVLLIAGYFVYGTLMSRIFGQDKSRPTPVQTMADGVDYIRMKPWRIFLIQFLNIAGLGPIFGAIMGIMFGPSAFLWIVLGTIFGGAVHDYMSGMMSLRQGGTSLPDVVGGQLGSGIRKLLGVFAVLLLILVGAVFVYNPADLLAMLTPESLSRNFWVAVIFIYYMAATLLPIDRIIGKIYPVFGFALLFMAAGIMAMLYVHHADVPELWDQFYNHKPDPESAPIFPMMFISIACGAISGFHATQSPMMARCLPDEKYGQAIFYGAMVAEGIVALIWAAAAVTFCHGYDGLQQTLGTSSPAVLVNNLSRDWLGTVGGILAIFGVIAAPITTGDTALRSARLMIADLMKYDQKKIVRRLLISVPVFVLCFTVMLLPYEVLWRYFAWCNQVLSVFTLWAVTVWLARNRKAYIVTLLPAIFMTMVTVTYILFAPEGFALPYWLSLAGASLVAFVFLSLFARTLRTRTILTPAED